MKSIFSFPNLKLKKAAVAVGFGLFAPVFLGALTYTVTNTNDAGVGSLRQAILDANVLDNPDNIHFNIPGAGAHVITISSAALPFITEEVTIDGSTQPTGTVTVKSAWTSNELFKVATLFPCTIKNLIIDGNGQSYNGILGDTEGFTVQNCTVKNCPQGINSIRLDAIVSVTGCQFIDCSLRCFMVDGASTPMIFLGNTFAGNFNVGVVITNMQDVKISTTSGDIQLPEGCGIENSGGVGVSIASCLNMVFDAFNWTGAGNALFMNGCDNVTVKNCTFSGYFASVVYYASSGLLSCNVFQSNNQGIQLINNPSSGSITVQNSSFNNSNYDIYNDPGDPYTGTITATGNFWGSPYGPNRNCVDRILESGATITVEPYLTAAFPCSPMAAQAVSCFLVKNTNNAGFESLRWAITAANANPGADNIHFDIPGAGPHSISLLTALPTITESITIDGSTEPDFIANEPPVIIIPSLTTGSILKAVGAVNVTIKNMDVSAASATNNVIGIDISGVGLTNVTLIENVIGNRGEGIKIVGNALTNLTLTDNEMTQTGNGAINKYALNIEACGGAVSVTGTTFGTGYQNAFLMKSMDNRTIKGAGPADIVFAAGNGFFNGTNIIEIDGCTGTSIDGVNLSHFGPTAAGAGITLKNSKSSTVKNCFASYKSRFIDCQSLPLPTVEPNLVIEDNTVGNCTIGFWLQSVLGNMQAERNTWTGAIQTGVQFFGTSNVYISDVVPAAPSYFVIEDGSGISNAVDASISIAGCVNMTVDGLDLTRTLDATNTGIGINAGANLTENLVIKNCHIENRNQGIVENQCKSSNVNCNVIIDNNRGIATFNTVAGGSNVFVNNVIVGNSVRGFDSGTSAATTNVTNNYWGVGGGAGQNGNNSIIGTVTNTGFLAQPPACANYSVPTCFTVSNANNSGACSLRQAILEANANPGPDVITFNIPGAGPHSITLLTNLPTITESITMDGSSEPDFVPGDAPVIIIPSLTTGSILKAVGAANVTINNIDVSAPTATNDVIGIDLSGAGLTNVTLIENVINRRGDGIKIVGNAATNLTLTDNKMSQVGPTGKMGMHLEGCGGTVSVTGTNFGALSANAFRMKNMHNITIKGSAPANIVFEYNNGFFGSDNVIEIDGCNGTIIDGVDVSRAIVSLWGTGIGIAVKNSMNTIIRNCTAGLHNTGIHCSSLPMPSVQPNLVIEDNFAGNGSKAIWLENVLGDIHGKGNTFLWPCQTGLTFSGINDVYISDVLPTASSYFVVENTGAFFDNITNFENESINIVGCANMTIDGLNLTRTINASNLGTGILASGSTTTNLVIKNCHIENRINAILENQCFSSNVNCNVLIENDRGVLTQNTASGGLNVFENNVIAFNTVTGFASGTTAATTDVSNNWWGSSAGPGTGGNNGITGTVTNTGFLSSPPACTNYSTFCFEVSNTDDSGPCSFRQAILDANANAGADVITFNIPGAGPHSISVLTDLPTVSESLTIDGTSQPGYAGSPIVKIGENWVGGGSEQVLLRASGATTFTVKGLDFSQPTTTTDDVFGLGASSCGTVIFENNWVRNRMSGITVSVPSTALTITGNDLTGSGGMDGSAFYLAQLPAAATITVSGNLFGGGFVNGVTLVNSVGVTVGSTAGSELVFEAANGLNTAATIGFFAQNCTQMVVNGLLLNKTGPANGIGIWLLNNGLGENEIKNCSAKGWQTGISIGTTVSPFAPNDPPSGSVSAFAGSKKKEKAASRAFIPAFSKPFLAKIQPAAPNPAGQKAGLLNFSPRPPQAAQMMMNPHIILTNNDVSTSRMGIQLSGFAGDVNASGNTFGSNETGLACFSLSGLTIADAPSGMDYFAIADGGAIGDATFESILLFECSGITVDNLDLENAGGVPVGLGINAIECTGAHTFSNNFIKNRDQGISIYKVPLFAPDDDQGKSGDGETGLFSEKGLLVGTASITCNQLTENGVGIWANIGTITATNNAIWLNSIGIQKVGPLATINAANNFWGSSAGPGVSGNNGTSGSGISTAPFLTVLPSNTPPCAASAAMLPDADIAVSGNTNNITDGDNTPSLTDWTDFGVFDPCQFPPSNNIVRTFVIENEAAAGDLTLTGLTITGAGSIHFSVFSGPTFPFVVPANSTVSFEIEFDPQVLGTHQATINIASDDPDENPFNFDIKGEAASSVVPTVAPIADKTICSPAPSDDGLYNISMSGTPDPGVVFYWTNDRPDLFTGDLAAAAGTSTTGLLSGSAFNSVVLTVQTATITVTPRVGLCSGTPDIFTIKVVPELSVTSALPMMQEVCEGSPTQPIVIVTNLGTGAWTAFPNVGSGLSGTGDVPAFIAQNATANEISSVFEITATAEGCTGGTATATIDVKPTPGQPTADFYQYATCHNEYVVGNNLNTDLPTATISWTLDNTGIGQSASGTGDIFSFTATNSTAVPIIGSFVIMAENDGCVSPKTLVSVSVNANPTNAAATPAAQTVAQGAMTTAITMTGQNAGYRQKPYVPTVATPIPVSGSLFLPIIFTDFLTAATVADVDIHVCVQHTALDELTLKLRHPDGTEVVLFEKQCSLQAKVFAIFDDDAPTAASTCFNYFSGQRITPFGGSDLSAFDGKSANGVWQLIVIDDGSNGSGVVEFAQVYLKGNQLNEVATWSMDNDLGGGTSGNGAVNPAGTAAKLAAFTTNAAGVAAVSLEPKCHGCTAAANVAAAITVNSNVGEINVYSFVSGSPVNILDGDLTPSTADNTDFGTRCLNSTTTRAFVIENTSASPIVISNIALSGSSYFSLPTPPTFPITLVPGNTTISVDVAYLPTAAGTHLATLTITNNDADENPYTFELQGTALSASANMPTNQSFCAGTANGAVTLTGTPATNMTYAWSNDRPDLFVSPGLMTSGTNFIPAVTSVTTFPSLQTATFSITPTYSDGVLTCVGPTVSFTMDVKAKPSVSADPVSQSLCPGDATQNLVFTSVPAGANFSWSNNQPSIGLAASGTGGIAPFVVSNSGMTSLFATITVTPTLSGCVGTTTTATIQVKPKPVVTLPSDLTVCPYNSFIGPGFTSVPSAGATFNWTNSNTAIGLGASGAGPHPAFLATNSTNAAISGTISVTSTVNLCMSDPANRTITVNPLTQISVSNPIQSVCAGSMTQAMVPTSTDPTATFTWKNKNTAIGIGANGSGAVPAFSATNSGSTGISGAFTFVATSGANGCESEPYFTSIGVQPLPQPAAPASQTVCAGTAVAAITPAASQYADNFLNNTETAIPDAGSTTMTVNVAGVPAGWTIADLNVPITLLHESVNQLHIKVKHPDGTEATVLQKTFCGVLFGLWVADVFDGQGAVQSNCLFGDALGNIQPIVANVSSPTAFDVFNGKDPSGTWTFTFIDGAAGKTGQVYQAGLNFVYNVPNSAASWTMSPNVGGGASGTGSIPAFSAQNATANPIVSTVSVSYFGCAPTAVSTITVNPTPTITATNAAQAVCAGSSTVLVDFSSNVAGATFSWTNNTTAIGLAASGSGDIAPFSATNATGGPLIGNISTAAATAAGCVSQPIWTSIGVNLPPVGSTASPATQTIYHSQSTAAITATGTTQAAASFEDLNSSSIPFGGFTKNIVVSGFPAGATIADLNLPINLVHPNLPELTMKLTHPDGTQVTFFALTGCSGSTFPVYAIFDDQGANLSTCAQLSSKSKMKPFIAPGVPTAVLNAFNGKSPNGTWVFEFIDNTAGNTGTLNSTGLDFILNVPNSVGAWTMSPNVGGGTSGSGSFPAFSGQNLTPSPITSTVSLAPSCLTCSAAPIPAAASITVLPSLNISGSSGAISCVGAANGTVSATATGGLPPFTYLWTVPGGAMVAGQTLTGLSVPGNYTVTATDANGGTDQISVTLNQNMNLPDVTGLINEPNCASTIAGATVTAMGSSTATQTTLASGVYNFVDLNCAGNYTITPTKDGDDPVDITILDAYLMTRHILGIELFGSPYQIIKGDVNRTGGVTALDANTVQNMVLGSISTWPNGDSWRFVERNYVFPNPATPFSPAFPEATTFNPLNVNQTANFYGMKIGNCACSAVSVAQDVTFLASDATVTPCGAASTVSANGFSGVGAFQFSMSWDPAKAAFSSLAVLPNLAGLTAANFNVTQTAAGKISVAWLDPNGIGQTLANGTGLFRLTFLPMGNMAMTTPLVFSDMPTARFVYGSTGNQLNFLQDDAVLSLEPCIAESGATVSSAASNCVGAAQPVFSTSFSVPQIDPNSLDPGAYSMIWLLLDPTTGEILAKIQGTGPTYSATFPAQVVGNYVVKGLSFKGTFTQFLGQGYEFLNEIEGDISGCIICGDLGPAISWEVKPLPTVISVADFSVCHGFVSAPLAFSSIPAGATFSWTNSNPAIGLAASGIGGLPTWTATNAGGVPISGTVVVTPTLNGCTGPTMTFQITVNPGPLMNAIADQAFCDEAAVSIALTSPVLGTTFSWTNSNTAIGLAASGNGSPIAFTATNAGNAPISATITVNHTANGCIGSPEIFEITIHPLPSVSAVPAAQSVCNGAFSQSIIFSSNVAGANFTWTNSAPSINLAASGAGGISSFQVTNGGATAVTAIIAATATANGCSTPGFGPTATITVLPTPNAVATPSSQTICSNAAISTINLTGAVAGTAFSWTRTNTANVTGIAASGSGNISGTLVNTTFLPQTVVFSITPTANNCAGAVITASVTVNPTPDVSLLPTAQTICSGATIATIQPSSNVSGATFSWTRDQVLTVTGIAASGSGAIGGALTNSTFSPQTVQFIFEPTASGCVGATSTATATVNPVPTATASQNAQTVCNGAAATAINFSSAVAGTVFSWSNSSPSIGLAANGTGNIASFSAQNASNAPVLATITVTPSFTNAGQTCPGQPIQVTILVNPTPTVAVDPTAQAVCNGLGTAAISFTSNVVGTAFSWTNNLPSVGLAASGSGNIGSFAAQNGANAPVMATITVLPTFTNGGASCLGQTATATITVNPTPTVAVFPASQPVCNGALTQAIAFSGTVANTVFDWSNSLPSIGLAAFGTGNIAAFSAQNASNAPVTATITATPIANACTGPTATATITVNPTPTVAALPTAQAVCNQAFSQPILFSSNVAGAAFSWTNSLPSIGLAANGTGDVAAFLAQNGSNLPVTATITVLPTANNCSGATATSTVTVNPTPTVVQVPNQSPRCNGTTQPAINFTSAVPGTTFSWTNDQPSIGLAASGTGNIGAFQVVNLGTQPILATITVLPSANNCNGQPISFFIIVNPSPVANAGQDVDLCPGTSGQLQGSAAGIGPFSYQWGPTTGLAGQFLQAPFVFPNATTTYTLTVTDANNCSNTDQATVNVLPAVVANAGPDVAICANGSVQLGAAVSGGAAPFEVFWGPVTGLSDPTILDPIASPAATTTYTLTAIDANGCEATDQMTVTVSGATSVNAGADVAICEGNSTQLSATASGNAVPPLTWVWSPAAGLSASNVPNPTASPAVSTTYTVVVTDANGCSASDQILVTVNQKPLANAGADQTICPGKSAQLGASATGGTVPYAFAWTPAGSLSNASIPNPVASPTVSTIYSVTVADQKGCTSTDAVAVNIAPAVAANAGADAEFCAGGSTVLSGSATGGTGAFSFAWSPAAGLSNAAISNPTASPATATTYLLTATDALGCTATDQVLVTTNALPTANAGPDQTFCSGVTAQLDASGSTSPNLPLSFLWSPAAGLSNATIFNPTASVAGTFSVQVTDAKGCSATDAATVAAFPAFSVGATASDATICFGSSAFLTATTAGGAAPFSFVWSPAGSLSSPNSQNPTASPTASTTYFVTATDANGCTATASILVEVLAEPSVTASVLPTAICVGQSAALSATASGAAPLGFLWSPAGVLNNATLQSPTASPAATTVFSVLLTDANGCTATASTTLTVSPTPTAVATATPATICSNGSAQLDASGSTGVGTFNWSPGNSLNDVTIVNPFALPNATTVYTVTVTAPSGGCSATASVTVTVVAAPVLTITNAECTVSQTAYFVEASTSGADQLTSNFGTVVALGGGLFRIENVPSGQNIIVRATNSASGCFDEKAVSSPNCACPFLPQAAGDTMRACAAGPLMQLTATVPGNPPGVTVDWYDAPGGNLLQAGSLSFLPPGFGTFYALTREVASGCTAISFKAIPLISYPALEAKAGDDFVVCGSEVKKLDGSASTGAAGLAFEWSPTAGLSAPFSAKTDVSIGQTTTFSLKITDLNNCTDTDDVLLTFSPAASVDLGSDAGACFGQPKALNAAASGTSPFSFEWSPTAGLSDPTIQNPTATITQPTVFSVKITDASGCSATDDIALLINLLPTADAGADSETCEGAPKSLDANGSSSLFDITWSPAAGLSDAKSAAPTVLNPTADQIYTLLIADANGCTATDAVFLDVKAGPTADAGSDAGFCEIGKAQLDGSASVPGAGSVIAGFAWSPAASVVSPTSAATGVLAFGTFTLVVTNSSGCSDSDEVVLTKSGGPTAVLAASSLEFCQNAGPGQLDASSSTGAGLGFLWSGPGGFSSVLTNPTVYDPGNYLVVVTDADGCSNSATASVAVHPQPTVAANGPAAICVGNAAVLSASANGGTAPFSFLWSDAVFLNDPILQNPTATIASATVFSVTATDAKGCSATDATDLIAVNAPPTADAGPDLNLCPGGSAVLAAKAEGGTPPLAFLWSPATGLNFDNILQPTASPNGLTFYQLLVTDANGCTATDGAEVQAVATFAVSAGQDDAFCVGSTTGVQLAAFPPAGPGLSFLWSPATGLNDPTSATPTALPGATTVYSLVVTNANGNCMDSDAVEITVNPLPTVEFLPASAACLTGNDVPLAGSPAGGTFSGPGISGNVFDPTAAGVGLFTANYSFTDPTTGCSASDDGQLEVYAQPTAIAFSSSPICDSEDLFLNETGGFATAWMWSGPGSFSSTEKAPTIPMLAALEGDYSVQISDANGCTAISTVPVVFLNGSGLAFESKFLINRVACVGDSVHLIEISDTATTGNPQATAFYWQFGDGTTSDERDPVHIWEGPGDFLVQVTVYNLDCPNFSIEKKISIIDGCRQTEGDDIFAKALLYPTVSDGSFRVDVDLLAESELLIEIFDLHGRQIQQKLLPKGLRFYQNFVLENTGVYFVSLNAGRFSKALKAVIID